MFRDTNTNFQRGFQLVFCHVHRHHDSIIDLLHHTRKTRLRRSGQVGEA